MNKETIEEAARRMFGDDEDGNYLEKRAFIKGAKWQQEKTNTSQVTRVEVIQHSDPYNGRAYTNYNASNVEMYLQDDSKTLKIFLI